jgi:hypothetical protein
MEPEQGGVERAPEGVERFVRQLLVTYKAAKLYPPASEIPRESAADLLGQLRLLLRERSDLRFGVTKDGLVYDGAPVLVGQAPFEQFSRELYSRNLAEVRFHAGATEKEVIDFLRTLQEAPEAIDAAGGFEQRLWDQQVDSITVREVSTKIVDTELSAEGAPAAEAEPWPPDHESIDRLIESAYSARPRDQRMLVRFVQDPRLVAEYLRELVSSGRGGRPLLNLVAGRVVSLAHIAFAELAEDQPELFRSIAEAVLGLDPALRRELLIERLLPDARLDEAVAGMLHQIELGELCRALVEGLSEDQASREGLARALRNLAAISMQPRETVLEAARGALEASGAEEGTVTAVIEAAAPAQLRVRPRATEERDETLESVLRLVDLAPVAEETKDPAVVGLKTEAQGGISDGDIMLSIVTLVSLERRPETFASLMAMVEDRLGLLLEWGEYGDAADAAAALASMQLDGSLDEAQRARVADALGAMAAPKYMREVAAAMRIHRPGSAEHEACRRLLVTLGGHTIAPLLEVLADEPDMAARKALVDLLSGVAPENIAALGERVTDPRWYFVRNVVSILGSTRVPEALVYLNRTIRHVDARVRRETIRAAAAIRGRPAEELLVAALADDDAQNVALAARYLGTLGCTPAAGALIAVARGEGRGNRDVGPRVEAIEALGRIGAPEAERALREIAQERGGIVRSGRSREVRTAAEAALAEIERARREGGA